MAPPDWHLRCSGPWTAKDFAGLWIISQRERSSPISAAGRTTLTALPAWTLQRQAQSGGQSFPKFGRGESEISFHEKVRKRRVLEKEARCRIWVVFALQFPAWEARACLLVSPEGGGRLSGDVPPALTVAGARGTTHPALQPAPVKRAFRRTSVEPWLWRWAARLYSSLIPPPPLRHLKLSAFHWGGNEEHRIGYMKTAELKNSSPKRPISVFLGGVHCISLLHLAVRSARWLQLHWLLTASLFNPLRIRSEIANLWWMEEKERALGHPCSPHPRKKLLITPPRALQFGDFGRWKRGPDIIKEHCNWFKCLKTRSFVTKMIL